MYEFADTKSDRGIVQAVYAFDDAQAEQEILRGLAIEVVATIGGIAVGYAAAKRGMSIPLAIVTGITSAIVGAKVAERLTRPKEQSI